LGNGRLDIATILLDASAADDAAEVASWARRARARGLGIAIEARGAEAIRSAVATLIAARAGGAPGASQGGAVLRLDLHGQFEPADLRDLAPDVVLAAPAPATPAALGSWSIVRQAKIDLAVVGEEAGAVWNPFEILATVGGGWPAIGGTPGDQGRREALRMLTLGAARAAGRDREIGCLAVGCCADFVVVSRDPLAAPDAGAGPAKVLSTWLDGKKIFSGTGP